MSVGQVILGRPWLFNKNVTIYSRSNTCQFEHESKQIKLLPWNLRLDNPSTHPLWLYCQLHLPHLLLLLFPPYL